MIALQQFTGESPKTIPTLLPPTASQQAVDCDFTEGALRGIRERLDQGVAFPAGIKSLFIYDGVAQNMYTWPTEVDVERGPIPDDAYGRFYWTDGNSFNVSIDELLGGQGKGLEPSTTYKVGVPTPTAAMSNAGATVFTIPGATGITVSAGVQDNTGAKSQLRAALDATVVVGAGGVTVSTPTALTKSWSGMNFSLNPTKAPTTTTTTAPTTDTNGNVTSSGTTTSSGGGTITYEPYLTISWTDSAGQSQSSTYYVDGSYTATTSLPLFTGSLTSDSVVNTDGTVSNANTLTLTLTANTAYLQARTYTYTYVNAWGEESGPAPGFSLDALDGQPLSFSIPNPTATGYMTISYIRVYRTATGSNGTNFLFVAQLTIPSGTATTWTDDVLTANLGETLPTMNYAAPPQQMSGLCTMNNGILVGFYGNELYFMEPYLPYAFDPSYIKPLPFKIVDINPTDGGLYVTTTSYPYIITGMTPDTMTDTRLDSVLAGVSKNSLINVGITSVYASNEGLVMMRGAAASMSMSLNFFTRNAWRDRYGSNLANIRLNLHDGGIIAWFTDGSPGFMIRYEETDAVFTYARFAEGNLSFTELSDPIEAAFRNPVGDALYVVDAGVAYAYAGGTSSKAFSWWSKDFVTPTPVNYGWIQLVGLGAVTYELFADGVSKATGSVTLTGADTDIFRLPGGYKARRHSIKLTGAAAATIKECYLVSALAELRQIQSGGQVGQGG